MHRVPHTLDVDIEDHVPRFFGQVLEVVEGDDPMVHRYDVDVSELAGSRVGGGFHRREVGTSATNDRQRRSRSSTIFYCRGQVGRSAHRVRHPRHRGASVDHHDVGALLGQESALATTLPMGATGDERDLALDPPAVRRVSNT